MSTFLLEIGTEELPADFARLALPQLEQQVKRDLEAARLTYSQVETTSTPRRLVVQVSELADGAPDLRDERKGPPAAQAFKDGVPTQAAIGFARRCGVEPSVLEVRETPKGPFVFAEVLEEGRPARELLAEAIPQWIAALQGRRFMRWGVGESRFSRPVRWLVALLGSELIPVTLTGSDPVVHSGQISRGHRLFSDAVPIPSAEDYAAALAAAGVVVHRHERAETIRRSVEQSAAALDAVPDLPDDLFEELTDLVETPLLIEGDVADHYLGLPAEVLSTVMRAHQRYVPLYRKEADADPLALDARKSLLSRFLCIGNGLAEATDTVRRGNERVLKARLADAEFFVEADRAVPSIDRRDQLKRVTFAEGLGSLLDRVERLEWLTDVLADQLDLSKESVAHARRAAHLCKHDLVSQMVGEFPELQGVMGGKYLLAEGEPREVALAVLEHYQPKGAGDALPSSVAGAVVALAERFELLLSIYAKGERPTGSSDPYALRRAGNGILQILWDQGWSLNLKSLLERATVHWASLLPHFKVDAPALAEELGELMRQRLQSLLEEAGTDADLVQAVAGESVSLQRLLADPADARQRAALLQSLRSGGDLSAVQAVVTRAAKLAAKGDLSPTVLSANAVVDETLFEKGSEAGMLVVLNGLEPIATGSDPDRYGQLAQGLIAGSSALSNFFDGEDSVMVMAEDPAIRTNRLNLLGVLNNQASVLADFSRISG
ncbi:glycine--tRNA ligase subunit beta [Synechococcus sp. A10-1-5-1]|uniref:glycine--tRNA ligase subunit beta n=1 Tax=Synechococcus sp. A10-1-5-1 TaxID=2936507 RepID=UPI002001AC94|nr:glycine--tRNA ligase subunit beta [Synechococcus sp. A10-1-5-1]UPM50471.1 glycine--tRNA ligase subunit beta [Synechococcus sp. A10-1-5-1]